MNDDDTIVLRLIEREDDPAVASIIRAVMTEFGAVGQGYSIEDPEVDTMFATYHRPRAAFWVIETSGEIAGCGGYAPLKGGEPDTCELQKMYFLPALRGRGMGQRLMHHCLEGARTDGFRRIYLETLENMDAAGRLYRHFGFQEIDSPLGATGHCGCDRWMVLDLDNPGAKL
jgi:putative acetyltransferase